MKRALRAFTLILVPYWCGFLFATNHLPRAIYAVCGLIVVLIGWASWWWVR